MSKACFGFSLDEVLSTVTVFVVITDVSSLGGGGVSDSGRGSEEPLLCLEGSWQCAVTASDMHWYTQRFHLMMGLA